MKTAIIGLPMVGKTSLFTILTGAHEAGRVGSMEARMGVTKVPDSRLGALAKPAESALVLALGDDHAAVRQTAYYALGSLQSEADRTRSVEQQLKSA